MKTEPHRRDAEAAQRTAELTQLSASSLRYLSVSAVNASATPLKLNYEADNAIYTHVIQDYKSVIQNYTCVI